MSKTIDERVVEMRFDNKQFESGAQTTMSTLDKLKKSLNMDGATRGLESIDNAAKKVDMSGLGSAVETVKLRFSALEVMAVTALANITNSVINTGKEMLSSLTVAPIKQGFNEYELKMGSIQTIMMSTGASLEEVNKYLNDLNTYSDKTIYSFQDMTSNIGKFTNAGVGLEDAVMAIQGVSNAAAVSGANTQEASRAMYNFAQALSAGYVKLIDWKSIENANMATVEFKTQLLESAVACGTLEKTADGMYRVLSTNAQGSTMDGVIDATHNFNDSLSYQWMTTDALVNTLRDYADETTEIGKKAFAAAQDIKTFSQLMDTLQEAVGSGWAMTYEILFGDFEEAKTLWTSLGNTIGGFIDAQSNARNEMLQSWKDLGGRTVLIEGLQNAFEGLKSVIKPISEAFREIFPATTGKQLYNLTEGFKEFTSKLKLSDTASANLKSTFKGLFAILDIVKQAFLAIFRAIKPLFGGFSDLGDGVLGFTGGIGDAIVKFDEFIKTSGVFQKVSEAIASILETVVGVLTDFKNAVKEKLESSSFENFQGLLETIKERLSQIGEAIKTVFSGIIEAFETFWDTLSNSNFLELLRAIWKAVKTIAGGIVRTLGNLISGLLSAFSNADFSGAIDLLNGISIGGIALAIKNFLSNVGEPLEGLKSILSGVTDILDGVRGCFEAYQQKLQAGTLLKIASAIAILAAAIVAITLVDSAKLNASLGAITVLFADLMGSMAIFDKISGQSKGIRKGSMTMIAMAASILILAGALKKIAELDMDQLGVGLLGVASLATVMVVAAKAMSSNSKTIMKGATQMVMFAVAIKILAGVCEQLSKLDWGQLERGLIGVGVLLAEVSLFLRTAKMSSKAIGTATGIVILSAAIKILAGVCKEFGEQDWKKTAVGLGAIGILLGELAVFTRVTGNAKHVVSTGIALIAIAAAIKIFASAVQDFSKMNWDEIARGLAAMAGVLTEVTLAVNFMPKNMVGIGVGLISIAAALLILANGLEKMSKMTWGEIARGLVALGGAMAILAGGLRAMTGTLSGSAALLVAATALLVLTPSLLILGKMSWGSIVKGLVTLAGAFAVLGVAGLVLSPLAPAILALSASLAIIGAAVIGIGAGLLLAGTGFSALAVGITAFSVSATAGATAIVAALTVIITGIAALIPAIAAKIGEAIVTFCEVIANSADAIGEAVKTVVLMLVDVLVECVPTIADGALKIIDGVLEALVEYTPSIVDSLFQFLIEVLDGVARNLPALIQSAVDVLMSFFSGVIDALKGIDTETLVQGIAAVGLLAGVMAALSAVAALVPGAMIGVLGMGAVIAELALVLAAVGAFAQIPGLNWLINEGGNLLQGIGTAIGKFVGGIVGGFMSGVSSQFPQIGSDLSGFMTNVQPFLDGASSIDPTMLEGVKALAETILILTAANILDGLTSWFTGGSSLSEFADELVPFGKAMKEFSEEISGMDSEAVSNAAIAGKTLAEMADTIPNSGGVVGFFVGNNDMDTFGEQLIPFGKAMKNFSNEVAGIDANVISEAATAGKALAEMADTIPNSGGVVGFFVGNNNMDDFGDQLVPFGKAMKEYSDSVSGIKADVIQNSVTAGKALMELADTVPNTGGVVSWFTGNNDLDTFAEQLIPFGKAMKDYSVSVTGLDADVVTNSANAAKALAELANNLPNTGGIVSWFSGDNDIGSFGKQLVSFGESFSDYYDSVSGIDTAKLSGVIDEFSSLVDLANGVKSVDTSGMSGFAKSLKDLGNAGVDSFIEAFDNANSRVTSAANTMITAFIQAANTKKSSLTTTFTTLVDGIIKAFTSKYSQFTSVGKTSVVKLVSGINSNTSTVKTAFSSTVSDCLAAIRAKSISFKEAGASAMTSYANGVTGQNQPISKAFLSSIASCIASIRYKYNEFYNAGTYLVAGFGNGISSYTWYAEAKSRAMANSAARAARQTLSIHSPSKVGYKIGEYFGMGFVNSIVDYATKAYDAGDKIATSARAGLANAVSKIGEFIENGIDSQPTIRPILDLSQAQQGARTLSALMSKSQAMSVNAGFMSGPSVVAQPARNQNSGNNTDVVNAIGRLQRDVESLGNTISKMQILLDGDAVVGRLITRIDSKLNDISINKGRGN